MKSQTRQCSIAGAVTPCLAVRIAASIVIFLSVVILETAAVHAAETRSAAAGEWDKTVEAAKKEGKVVVSVPASAELRRATEKTFKQ